MEPISIAMMLGSIGLQYITNRKNNELARQQQEHQRELQLAYEREDQERIRKLQKESAKLSLQLEADVHKQRLDEIEQGYDEVIKDFIDKIAIDNWPLTVLPFFMRGESFGSLFGGIKQSINMHCVLTPSNCRWFNEFYNNLDEGVERYMNEIWNSQSSHPVVYYGGGWNRRRNGRVTEMDLDDIDLLFSRLKSVPFMVITPYFSPNLQFRVRLWGMGQTDSIGQADSKQFILEIPRKGENGASFFSHEYNKDNQPEMTDEFANTTISEIVPYITCLIGFVADVYFGSFYGVKPILPYCLKERVIKVNYSFDNILNGNEYKLLEQIPFDIRESVTSTDNTYTPSGANPRRKPLVNNGVPPENDDDFIKEFQKNA